METTWELHRLQHDASFKLARHLVECIQAVVPEEHWEDYFIAFFEIALGEIRDYEARAERQLRRLYGRPGVN